MNRRQELERELDQVQKLIDTLPEGAPKALLEAYRKEKDSIAFELNNLYDDPETETE